MKQLFIYFVVVFTICSCSQKSIIKYPLNETYYLKTSTVRNNGYTWTYLCNKKDGSCVNIYGEDAYSGRIENIRIEKVVNDTAVFVTFYQGFKNCRYKVDTLILSEKKLASKSEEKDCPLNAD